MFNLYKNTIGEEQRALSMTLRISPIANLKGRSRVNTLGNYYRSKTLFFLVQYRSKTLNYSGLQKQCGLCLYGPIGPFNHILHQPN